MTGSPVEPALEAALSPGPAAESAVSPGPAPEEMALIAALREGSEQAFVTLLDRYGGPMLRLALLCTPNRALAEEIVQEAWIGVVQGIDRFEGRSSLKTWLSRIVLNIARTRAEREGRHIPFSAFWDPSADPGEPSVDPDRFRSESDPFPGHWASRPRPRDVLPEERLLSSETRDLIREAIESLPPSQREVISLRDVDGWTSEEVCTVLGITATNQRVLLHRARSKVRRALEVYLSAD